MTLLGSCKYCCDLFQALWWNILWGWAAIWCVGLCSSMTILLMSHRFMDGFILQLYVHGEKFNQPIFFCNNISGHVEPVRKQWEVYNCWIWVWPLSYFREPDHLFNFFQVVPESQHRALYSTHSFKILFKEGGCGTFVPLFFNLISSVRQYNQQSNSGEQPRLDPLQAAQTPVDEIMRHA